ncbi:hypothetical protein N878_10695 [Pseudomonas sp. EGD-AK9]|nr:hypothetical protein N878_10695 [Pseudomonas sp. EGD-AK9]
MVDQQAQTTGDASPIREVEHVGGDRPSPTVQHCAQASLRLKRIGVSVRQIGNSQTVNGGLQQRHRITVDQTTLDTDLHTFLAIFEHPAFHGPGSRMAITDAIVAAQFIRVPWQPTVCQIMRRSQGKHALFRSQGNGYQVALDLPVLAKAGVESLGHQIHSRLTQHNIDVDGGIALQKGTQMRAQHRQIGWRGCHQTQLPGGCTSLIGDLVGSMSQLDHQGFDPLQKALTRLGQLDATGRTLEQHHPQPPLEAAHHLAYRRGGYAQSLGCVREAAVFGHLHKGDQTIEMILAHVQPLSWGF